MVDLRSQALEMLNKYLREFRPSHASCEHVAWICVSFCPTLDVGDDAVEQVQQHAGAGDKQEREGWSLEDRIDGLLETFEALEGMCPGVIGELVPNTCCCCEIVLNFSFSVGWLSPRTPLICIWSFTQNRETT